MCIATAFLFLYLPLKKTTVEVVETFGSYISFSVCGFTTTCFVRVLLKSCHLNCHCSDALLSYVSLHYNGNNVATFSEPIRFANCSVHTRYGVAIYVQYS